jgi:serine/threonine protein kinase
MDLQQGQVVDRYTVRRELGRGGMAVVYLVEHNTLETHHALKVLTVGSQKIRDRLIQEGKVQAQLRHPNVVAVTDVLDVDGSPGLLMEFVEGPAMDAWLLGKRLEIDEAEALFLGILDGVQRAHALGIVHRDLKPANVMLSEGPEGWVPKVADFGLAKALQEEGDMQRTRTGMPMGTPSYMSPEQIRDAKGVDERTDIFAMGCILYELTCGQRAFFGRDMLEIFNAVASGKHTASRTLVPDLPARLEQAINGCLVVDRERRIPDCATLRGVLKGEQHWQVAPPSVPDETFDFFGDGPAATAAQSEFLEAARNSLAHSQPSAPPPGGTFSLDDPDEAPAAASSPPATSASSMPGSFAGPSIATDPSHPPHEPTSAAREPAPASVAPASPSVPPAGPSIGDAVPPRAVLPWIIAALGIGAALSAGVFLMMDRGQPSDPAPATERGPEAPESSPETPEPNTEPPGPTPQAPPAAPEPLEPVNRPVDKPAERIEADKPAERTQADKPEPSAGSPSPQPEPLAAPEPDPAPTTAQVSYSGADRVILEEVDFRHRFTPGSQPIPPGRYRILAGFGGAEPVGAGEVELSAGQQVHLTCDPDFRRCRAR